MPPNIVMVFGDQWRAQSTGYASEPGSDQGLITPHLNALARQSVNFPYAISGCPVCTPARASYISGQRPLTNGVFLNDVYLRQTEHAMGRAFAGAGYDTAYIGKWHIDGHGSRSEFIPRDRRQGFENVFKVLECTHNYRNSQYYDTDDPTLRTWPGYDAFAQTHDACAWIRDEPHERPFLLVLSWGPPHGPCPEPRQNAPEPYRQLYNPENIVLRPNVPEDHAEAARRSLHNYYAYCTSLDECVGRLRTALIESGQADNTIFLFTSDHGEMGHSHGEHDKQRPWDESIRVPFLLHWPAGLGTTPRSLPGFIDCPDVLPTLLGLADIDFPDDAYDGRNWAPFIRGETPHEPSRGAGVIECPHPFGNWNRPQHGGREYRGLRTERFTYVRDLNGPWLLFDNQKDPFQLQNIVNHPDYADTVQDLDQDLILRLQERNDTFEPGDVYLQKWNHQVDDRGTVDFEW